MSDGRSDARYKWQYGLSVDTKTEAVPPTAGGMKQDFNKPQVSLIPSEAILEMAKAFTYGAQKYAAHNFKQGLKYSRLMDSAIRHLLAFNAGEDIDSESNNSHLGHAMASIAMLIYMHRNRTDLDDRYKQAENKTNG